MPADATGEQIFAAACATCHAADGTGSPQQRRRLRAAAAQRPRLPRLHRLRHQHCGAAGRLGGGRPRGGPVRGLDRHMPAFGDALSAEQIERVGQYLWTFCSDASWPRGDLNLPRAFFTEKAFPENETVWTTGVTTPRAEGRDQRARLRAPHRRARPVRSAVPFDGAAGRAGGLEPRPRRRRGRRAAHASTPATSAGASSPPAAP